MTKAEVEVAIAGLDSWGRIIDNWVLICATGVAIFLAAEVIFSVLHWRNENRLRPLRTELDRLHTVELAELQGVAEDAKARALEAQLSLEKFKSDRTFDGEQMRTLKDALKPFHGTHVTVVTVGALPETARFAADIKDILFESGWVPQPGTLLNGDVEGVVVKTKPDATASVKAIADALATALNGAGATASRGLIEVATEGRFATGASLDSGPIRVDVGHKLQ